MQLYAILFLSKLTFHVDASLNTNKRRKTSLNLIILHRSQFRRSTVDVGVLWMLIIQSHRKNLPADRREKCQADVKQNVEQNGFSWKETL